MTLFEVCLLVTLVLFAGLLAYAGHRIEVLQGKVEHFKARTHSLDTLMILEAIKGHQQAETVAHLIEHWCSVEGRTELAKCQYKASGGENIITMWLQVQADKAREQS